MGGVRNPVWCHSSSLFGLSCIRAPLLLRFSRGNTTEQHAVPPRCCSGLSVFRWVFSANQEPTTSTFNSLTHLHLPVCFSTALAAMAAELIQEDLTLTMRVGGNVSFSCQETNQCYRSYVWWYQKRDSETFTLILRFDANSNSVYSGYNHPQKNDFSAVRKQNGCELEIKKVERHHSASYYCSCEYQHSEEKSLQAVQKPRDEQISHSVGDRKRAVNHNPPSHMSLPSQPVTHILNWDIWDWFNRFIRYSSSFIFVPHCEDKLVLWGGKAVLIVVLLQDFDH